MLFSIITPTYNRADKIGSAIKSVLNQEYDNFELIVVDDGSTDNTQEVVNDFQDPRVFYFKKKNEERNIARNFGISKAKGEYVGFLDSDDILYRNHLSEAFAMIVKNHYPKVVHLNFEIANNLITNSCLNERHVNSLNDVLINDNILSCNSIFIQQKIIDRFQFLNSPNAIIGEDHYLWLRLSSRYKIHLSLEVTNAVIEHEKRSLNDIDIDKLIIGTKEIHSALSKDLDFLHYYGWRTKRYFAYRYVFLSLHLVLYKRKKECLRYLIIAFSIYPPCLFSKRFLAVIKNLFFNEQ